LHCCFCFWFDPYQQHDAAAQPIIGQHGACPRGESQVASRAWRPKDIAEMAHAFNNMMSVLEEREAA